MLEALLLLTIPLYWLPSPRRVSGLHHRTLELPRHKRRHHQFLSQPSAVVGLHQVCKDKVTGSALDRFEEVQTMQTYVCHNPPRSLSLTQFRSKCHQCLRALVPNTFVETLPNLHIARWETQECRQVLVEEDIRCSKAVEAEGSEASTILT